GRSAEGGGVGRIGGHASLLRSRPVIVVCMETTMTARPTDDPVLRRFKAALEAMYGDQIDRGVLFGSRARGDGHVDSDYDVAVFLKSLPDRWKELDRLADLRMVFLDQTGAFFDTKPYLSDAYQQRTPLMREIRRDGVEL